MGVRGAFSSHILFCGRRCQGSALGPLSFSMFINSVGSCFSSPFLLYADDLVLFDSGIDKTAIVNILSNQLEKLCEWCEGNGVTVNFEKTYFMIFHKERYVFQIYLY
jgi:hypothetical protein